MPSGMTLRGLESMTRQLREHERTIGRADTRWIVASRYFAHIPEFGSSRQAARPYFRPGLAEAARSTTLAGVFWSGGALKQLTKNAVEAIKKQIAARGLIRTGDLQRSIADGKTMREANQKGLAAIGRFGGSS